MLDQVIDLPRRMIPWQPVPQIRRQQHRLVLVIPAKRLLHRPPRPHRTPRTRLDIHQHTLLNVLRFRHDTFSRNTKQSRITDTGT